MLAIASIHAYRKKLADGNILFLLEFNSCESMEPVACWLVGSLQGYGAAILRLSSLFIGQQAGGLKTSAPAVGGSPLLAPTAYAALTVRE